MTTPTNDIPRVITEAPAYGKSYNLTHAQMKLQKSGKSIYSRDQVVEKYEVNKGEFV